MKVRFTIVIMLGILLTPVFIQLYAQGNPNEKSFLIMGDNHFDLWEDHDSSWLAQQGDDYRQVTQEYTVNTKANFAPFIEELLTQSKKPELNVKGIIQLGDLQEGLAGTAALAVKMAQDALAGLRAPEFPVPWILVKGNHDITGPGAPEAYNGVVLPFIQGELNQSVTKPYYSYTVGDTKIICIDCYDTGSLISYLSQELTNTTAKFKIIATHQPIVPVTARLWHIFQNAADSVKRDQLLNLIAKNKAIVLAGHLHKYSVVRRMTASGPFIQIMVNSVIRDKNRHTPNSYTTSYGPDLTNLESSFDPGSLASRRAYLAAESPFISNYRMAEMPGYAILNLNSLTGQVTLKAFSGLGQSMYEEVLLSTYELKLNKTGNGTIDLSPDDSTYLAGTRVTLKATGDLGWKFSSWSGDLNSTSNPDSILMDADKSVTALFVQLPQGQYELRTEVEGNGKLDITPSGPYYTSGTAVTIKAVADAGYKLEGWSGDASGTSTDLTVTMNSHKKIKALFSKIQTYKLNLGKTTHGTISITPSGKEFIEFTNVKLTAIPETGYELMLWTGDKSGNAISETIYMDSDKEVKALFKKTDGSVINLKPIEDSYIRGGLMYSDKNFNADTCLRVLEGNTDTYRCRSFLKFDLKPVTGEVYSAILKMKVKEGGLPDGTPAMATVYLGSNDTWLETTLKWKAAPAADVEIDSCTAINKELTIYSWDLTNQVKMKANAFLSLMIKDKSASGKTVDFYSKESSPSPELLIVTDKTTGLSGFNSHKPESFRLGQNYPNPFNPTSRILYSLPEGRFVKIRVFNVLGNEVASLVNEQKPAGTYSVEFDGSSLTSGVYFYRMEAGSFTDTKKLILAK